MFQFLNCVFDTSVRVASKVFFFVLLVQLLRETRGLFWSQFFWILQCFGKS